MFDEKYYWIKANIKTSILEKIFFLGNSENFNK
jgi:hypothetical protein